jgi:hypothetical protein
MTLSEESLLQRRFASHECDAEMKIGEPLEM